MKTIRTQQIVKAFIFLKDVEYQQQIESTLLLN